MTKADINDVRKIVIWAEEFSINRNKVKYDKYFPSKYNYTNRNRYLDQLA